MGTGRHLLPQRRSAVGRWGEARSHLGEDPGEFLAIMDSSVEKRARVKSATSQRKVGKGKALMTAGSGRTRGCRRPTPRARRPNGAR